MLSNFEASAANLVFHVFLLQTPGMNCTKKETQVSHMVQQIDTFKNKLNTLENRLLGKFLVHKRCNFPTWQRDLQTLRNVLSSLHLAMIQYPQGCEVFFSKLSICCAV